MPDEKNALRRELRARLRALTPAARSLASAQVCRHLLAAMPRAAGGLVAGFLPLPSEPDLADYYHQVRARGGGIAFPLITGPGAMEFRRMPPGTGGFPVRTGPHRLLEPEPAACPAAAAADIALVLVPGLGFAAGGGRLGRGAGYYDRWLAGAPGGVRTVGVGFACQILPALPCQPHDWPLDHVVTEDGWLPGARGLPQPRP